MVYSRKIVKFIFTNMKIYFIDEINDYYNENKWLLLIDEMGKFFFFFLDKKRVVELIDIKKKLYMYIYILMN